MCRAAAQATTPICPRRAARSDGSTRAPIMGFTIPMAGRGRTIRSARRHRGRAGSDAMVRTNDIMAGAARSSARDRTKPIRLQYPKLHSRGANRSGAAALCGGRTAFAVVRTKATETADRRLAQRRPLPSLFALDLQPARPEVDAHAFGLMAVLIDLIAQYGGDDRQGTDHKIKHVIASHG